MFSNKRIWSPKKSQGSSPVLHEKQSKDSIKSKPVLKVRKSPVFARKTAKNLGKRCVFRGFCRGQHFYPRNMVHQKTDGKGTETYPCFVHRTFMGHRFLPPPRPNNNAHTFAARVLRKTKGTDNCPFLYCILTAFSMNVGQQGYIAFVVSCHGGNTVILACRINCRTRVHNKTELGAEIDIFI